LEKWLQGANCREITADKDQVPPLQQYIVHSQWKE